MVNKINAKSTPQVEQARKAHTELTESVAFLVKGLHPREFELLVDLILREAGWKRIGEVGGPQKTFDLELLSPITNERIGVQVKSSSNRAEYLDYERRFSDMDGYSRFSMLCIRQPRTWRNVCRHLKISRLSVPMMSRE